MSKSPIYTDLTDQYTSSESSQIDSTQENLQIQNKNTFDNIEEEFDMADENVNVDQNEILEENEVKKEEILIKKRALHFYYDKVDLPDFPERMEEMLQTDKTFWDDRNKRHQFIQFLASYYYHQTTFTLDEKVIGYIYQPVSQKLIEKYENLKPVLNAVCVKTNNEILKGVLETKKE